MEEGVFLMTNGRMLLFFLDKRVALIQPFFPFDVE